MNKGKLFTHLHEEERVKIEVLLNQGFSVTSIARTLARPVCTISREIKRNGTSGLIEQPGPSILLV